ncbi:MAG: histidine phosphatase family protein, partial [Anaerolineales bacterium]
MSGIPGVIFVARHGVTVSNDRQIYAGPSDERLTARGVRQAEDLGQALLGRGIQRVVTSPLQRAAETGEIVSAGLGIAKPACSDLLDEMRLDRDATVFVFGNGGSASTASHMANDLSKAPVREGRRRPRVVSLSENVALMTAWSNEDSFTSMFEQQVRSLVRSGDLVIAISAIGKSPNVLAAARRARECGATVAALVGFDGGDLAKICDEAVLVDSFDYGWVESVHLCLEHYITCLLRAHVAALGA